MSQNTPRKVVESALRDFVNDGARKINLFPPATSGELEELQQRTGKAVPVEIRELLELASGVEFGPVGRVDFLGREMSVETFFRSVPILADGFGNFWIVDAEPQGKWGPVIFWCHDPPVVVIQARSLAAFLDAVFQVGQPGHEDQLAAVRKAHVRRIWSQDPYLLPVREAMRSSDPALATFARSLPTNFAVADLRACNLGVGFSWGRSSSEPVRPTPQLLFGVERKKSFLSRLFGT